MIQIESIQLFWGLQADNIGGILLTEFLEGRLSIIKVGRKDLSNSLIHL